MSLVFKSVSLLDSEKEKVRDAEGTAERVRILTEKIAFRLRRHFTSLNSDLARFAERVDVSYNEVNSGCKIILVNNNITTSISCYSQDDVCYSGQVNRNFLMENDDDIKYLLARYGSRNKIIKSVSASGSGALEYTGYNYYIGDDFIPLDKSKEYRISFIAEAMMSDGTIRDDVEVMHYGGIAGYDADKRFISVHNVYARPGTYGVMVNDVKAGDKYITVRGNPDRWYQGGSNHMRSVMIHKLRPDGKYGYIGSNGKYYTELGYTRDGGYNFFRKNSLVDNGDGTFTMRLTRKSSYDYPAGTRLNNSASGGSYNYWMSWWRMRTDAKLHHYKSPWKFDAMDKPTRYYWGIMRDGASYFKTMGLFTYRARDRSAGRYISTLDTKVKIHRFSLESRPKE